MECGYCDICAVFLNQFFDHHSYKHSVLNTKQNISSVCFVIIYYCYKNSFLYLVLFSVAGTAAKQCWRLFVVSTVYLGDIAKNHLVSSTGYSLPSLWVLCSAV